MSKIKQLQCPCCDKFQEVPISNACSNPSHNKKVICKFCNRPLRISNYDDCHTGREQTRLLRW